METIYVYGAHPVQEALAHKPACVLKVFADETHEDVIATAKRAHISVEPFSMKTLQKHIGEGVHQRLAAVIDADKLLAPIGTLLENEPAPDTAYTLLGEVQDPQNVGSIIRSAAAFGISGVLIPKDRQAQVTGAVIKASAGMAFRVPLIGIGNVNQTIRELKERGFWVYGLSGEAKQSLGEERFDAPAVFVIGNEGAGIREKTEAHCDVMLSIPLHARTESLNAAVSAAITFYSWSIQHPKALL